LGFSYLITISTAFQGPSKIAQLAEKEMKSPGDHFSDQNGLTKNMQKNEVITASSLLNSLCSPGGFFVMPSIIRLSS